ncbi:MAG: MFS transporter [Gammaproteobacteria bacterium]|nr:MFS transporter [Gammaproteobacteria bacterium]
MSAPLAIGPLVDGQRFGRFGLELLLLSFLAMFADGYDIAVMGFAAPELVRAWELAPARFAPVLTASLVGILCGAPILGWIGDRRGRRGAILMSLLVVGGTTLAIAAATSLAQIIVLRFLAGIGIGGLMPNAIALNSELAPRSRRATLVVLMFTGITVGGGAPGLVAAGLLPRYGWPVLFWVGGLVPLLAALLLYLRLPESVKFLARQPGREAQLRRLIARMRPDVIVPAAARFILTEPAMAGGDGARVLLRGAFALITPLLWLCFATALMTNYFLNGWLPLIFEQVGMSPPAAALASTLYHLGAAVGGILVSLLLDRLGFRAIAGLYALAVLAVAAIGWPGLSHAAITGCAALAGLSVLGAQFGNNAAAGLLYPPRVKSRGVGWALAVGRVGSIAGPLLGGLMLALGLPLQQLFLLASLPMVVGVVAALVLVRACHRRFGSHRIDDALEAGTAG